jgi:hypothetical protein
LVFNDLRRQLNRVDNLSEELKAKLYQLALKETVIDYGKMNK